MPVLKCPVEAGVEKSMIIGSAIKSGPLKSVPLGPELEKKSNSGIRADEFPMANCILVIRHTINVLL